MSPCMQRTAWSTCQNHARRIAVELERNRRAGYPHRSHYRIVFEEVATPFDKIDNIKDMLLVLIDVLHSKFLEIIFTLIITFGLISTSSPTCSRGGVGSSRHQYRKCISIYRS